jgi:transglutaminase-like putative cysteine protease
MVLRRRPAPPAPVHDPALDAAAAAAAAVATAEAAARRGRRSDGDPRTERSVGNDGAHDPVTAALAARPTRRRAPRASRIFVVRIGVVGVIGVALALLAGRAFDERVDALLVGPVAISLAALVGRRWALTARVALQFVALAGTTVASGLWTGSSLRGVAGDLADGPRRLLTTEWPSPIDPGVVMALAVAVTLCTGVAADLAGRPRFHIAPLAPLAVAFVVVLGVAAPVHAYRWLLLVVGGAAVMLMLARPGEDPRTRLRSVAGERSLLATAIGLVVAVLITSTAIAWTDRADPRQDVEPDLTLSVLDPIEQVAALRDVEPEIDLFRITDRSALIGPSLPARWRTSALATYDGQRWVPAVSLRPIGRRLGLPSPTTPGETPPIEFDLTALTDDLALLPLPGRPLEVALDDQVVQTDADRSVVRLSEPPEEGLTARIVSEVAPTIADADDPSIANRQVDDIASAFADTASELGGERSVLDQLRNIEAAMREWERDSTAPGGQQLTLIQRFVEENRRGTREQFVTAFVLLARSLGVDARVATGFLVPPDGLSNPLVLRSSYAAVWPEVRLTGRGWFAFDPVPAEEANEPAEDPPPPSAQSPAAAQPPDPPPNDRTDDLEEIDEEDATVVDTSTFRRWATRIGLVGGLMVLPVLLLVGSIVAAKWVRRRRRILDAEPARRIIGAWANATDALVDAGLDIRGSWTDERIATYATSLAPAVLHELHRLAAAATAMTFGSRDPAPAQVDDAIATSRAIDRAIRAERTRWQRLRWRLSTRSLRKRSRSPIAA